MTGSNYFSFLICYWRGLIETLKLISGMWELETLEILILKKVINSYLETQLSCWDAYALEFYAYLNPYL